MPVAIDIPLPLRHALELGEGVLFLGAGIGKHLRRPDSTAGLPDAAGLASAIATHFSVSTSSDDLSKVAELIQIRGRGDDLEDFIRKQFADVVPDDTIRWLCSRRWRAVFTTNYDRGFERGYDLVSNIPQKPIPISRTAELVHFDLRFEVPVYHIHGAAFGERQRLVISQTDYANFREQRRMLFELLKRELATSTFLYIGYSNRDPNWALLVNEIAQEFLPARLPPSYRVAPNTDPDDVEILKARGVETIDGDLEQFVGAAAAQLEPFHADQGRLKAIQATVPGPLLAAFEKNPAPVVRLLRSWQYVNEAPFSAVPNKHSFFRGDKPNWGLVAAGIPFIRDVESDLYDDVLDYVTSGADRPTCLAVVGPAGYGITTTLMQLAVHLVKERVGPVYFFKPGMEIVEGDIDFAMEVAEKQVACFVIDDAADVTYKVQNAFARLRDTKRPGVFVCGARMNEWRQRSFRLPVKEHIVAPLSEGEIDRLLDCLRDSRELNQLDPLDREMQRAVIREKHGKELLVAMREATEGKQFDAILEDEFFGINDEKCREVYLVACCFHQHGSLVRDALLCDVVNMSLADFYSQTKGRLDGVVIDECIDEIRGHYAFRTRHKTIARIVWERCGENAEKERFIQSSLEHLNLNYSADAAAFERFVRNDHLIDSIRGLENRIKFFDAACRKEPDSPYVRQHYARMLYRSEKFELALSQVNEGLQIHPKSPPRVLMHTKGMVLGALALSSENTDIGRRRLAQAEDAFRRVIQLNRRDEYAYQALATLYLDWAKKANTEDEAALYVTKAEETVSEGLRNCREKDGLWIVSSEIEKWLGNNPSRLKALEAAIATSPGSIVARYLLGRAYRQDKRYLDAIDVLEPSIRNHPDEFRSFAEYSFNLLFSGRSLREAIAVLDIASATGLSDARYIAQLGGMLFLDGDYGRAEKVFSESQRRELPQVDLQHVTFHAMDYGTGTPIQLIGKVIVRKPTYSMIEVEGHPHYFCHSSMYRGLALKEGMPVSFKVGFTARGANAVEPTEIA